MFNLFCSIISIVIGVKVLINSRARQAKEARAGEADRRIEGIRIFFDGLLTLRERVCCSTGSTVALNARVDRVAVDCLVMRREGAACASHVRECSIPMALMAGSSRILPGTTVG